MTFEQLIHEHSNRLTDAIAALLALTDVQFAGLPPVERDTLLALVREYAVEASLIASELSISSRLPGVEIDLATIDAPAAA